MVPFTAFRVTGGAPPPFDAGGCWRMRTGASYTRTARRHFLPTHFPRSRYVPQDSLTITDNRTGRTYEVPVAEGTVRATDLRQIKVSDDDFGLMTYDPAF